MARPFITQFISSFVSSFIGGDPWWGAWDPINGFAFDFKNDRYMSQGVDIAQFNAVTEGRSTDAYVLGGDGVYVLRSANEPAQANGHGLDGFDEIFNQAQSTDFVSAVVGTPGTLPTGWRVDAGGLTTDVVGLGTENGLPVIDLHVSGTLTSTFWNVIFRPGTGATAAAGDDWYSKFDIKLLAGAIPGSSPNAAVFERTGGGGFLASHRVIVMPIATYITVDQKATLGNAGTVNVDNAFSFTNVTIGTVVDFTIRLRAIHFTKDNPARAIVLTGTGTEGTRDADDTRVVQGAGQELVTGDRDDFTGSTMFDSATVTADQLGTADLVDLSGGVNARALYQPLSTLTLGATYLIAFDARSVSGTGTYPIAAFDGNAVFGGTSIALTEEFATYFIEVTVASLAGNPGIYIGNRRDGAASTLDQAYVRQGSFKAVTIAPGFSADPNELTFRVDWDGVAVGGSSRYLFEVSNAAGKRLFLFLTSGGELLLFANETGSNQGVNAGSGFDDGGAHSAVCYINQSTGLFKISADGGATVSGSLVGATPPNLNSAVLDRSAISSSNGLNGTNCRIQVAEGDFYDAFRDSSAGFF